MSNHSVDEQSAGKQNSAEEPVSVVESDTDKESASVSGTVAGTRPSDPGIVRRVLSFIWNGIILRRIFLKALTLIYALAVFGYAYNQMAAHRDILSYMGVMLLMVIVYAEILVIRDHLWVIEGSMRESRRWRDVFFNQTSLRRQRIRKFISILFSLGIFSYMYFKAGANHKPVLSFMGVMLMMTVLYYEILTIRDEIFLMGQSIIPCSDEESDKRKQHYDKFIEQTKIDTAAETEARTKAGAETQPPEHKS